jgi:Ca-activated chloride channel homolog
VAQVVNVVGLLRGQVTEWERLRLGELLFRHHEAGILTLVVVLGFSATMLLWWSVLRRRRGYQHVAVPAILAPIRQSSLSFVRHIPSMLFVAGLAFFIVALADPYQPFTQQEASFPGRRIALLIDASSSMVARFGKSTFGTDPQKESTFVTTVAAAETFVKGRIKGQYRDLIGLVEFGDEAYVVTPFTYDYDNILLSLSLIGDWTEFMNFPDRGTTIGRAVEQGVELFRAFEFMNATGNLMVVFSDGQDTEVTVQGRRVSDVMAEAVEAKIPVYFIRTSYDAPLGTVIPDRIWKPAVESTGGRFYAATDAGTILRAIRDIDRLAPGRIRLTEYRRQQPAFEPFALIAAVLWTGGLGLKLTIPHMRTCP